MTPTVCAKKLKPTSCYSIYISPTEDLSIFVIEQIHWEEANFRKAKESYWIQTLRSLAPRGIKS